MKKNSVQKANLDAENERFKILIKTTAVRSVPLTKISTVVLGEKIRFSIEKVEWVSSGLANSMARASARSKGLGPCCLLNKQCCMQTVLC